MVSDAVADDLVAAAAGQLSEGRGRCLTCVSDVTRRADNRSALLSAQPLFRVSTNPPSS